MSKIRYGPVCSRWMQSMSSQTHVCRWYVVDCKGKSYSVNVSMTSIEWIRSIGGPLQHHLKENGLRSILNILDENGVEHGGIEQYGF